MYHTASQNFFRMTVDGDEPITGDAVSRDLEIRSATPRAQFGYHPSGTKNHCFLEQGQLMVQVPRKRILAEYDLERVAVRLLFALIIGIMSVVTAHGGGWSWGQVRCNGGWAEAISFLGGFVCAIGIIEVLHWIAWRTAHRAYLISFEDREVLLGRGHEIKASTLFPARDKACQSEDYDLQVSGGDLALTPRSLFAGLLLGVGLLLLGLVTNPPSPCERPSLDWRFVSGWFVEAYAALVVGAVIYMQISRKR